MPGTYEPSHDTRSAAAANRILAALPGALLDRLLTSMTRAPLVLGARLQPAGSAARLFFPSSGVIAMRLGAKGAEAETSLIGSEGFAAPAALTAVESPYALDVVAQGEALSISADVFADALATDGEAQRIVQRYQHVLMVQTACYAAANAREPVEARLARWLLMCSDRVGPHLNLAHESISRSLSVRRAGVTVGIHVLEGYGALRGRRGHIEVIDRDKLRARAGSAYGIPEAEYARLLG